MLTGSHKLIMANMPTNLLVALVSLLGISTHLCAQYLLALGDPLSSIPLWLVLLFGGAPLTLELLKKALKGEFSSDLLAGISIVSSVILTEYLAGSLVVLMLSGGEALEELAKRKATQVLSALAKRMPNVAHKMLDGKLIKIALEDIRPDDILAVMPNEICPVDGLVVEGRGVMDESFLTGEPFKISKVPGSLVISGALNGESAITIKASKLASDSRYAKIKGVVEQAEQSRPRLRRLGDRLGALYTPLALGAAALAWALSGDPLRFLSVLVVATPCPLLIAIPVSIIGAVSLAAKRSIVIKDPTVLERIGECRTMIFDKTGTLTYGKPVITQIDCAPGANADEALKYAASLEQYSKHPLAEAVLKKATDAGLNLIAPKEISEKPGQGLKGLIADQSVRITGRSKLLKENHPDASKIPATQSGLECVLLVNEKYFATLFFHDEPRAEGKHFVSHLSIGHPFKRVMILSGDRESEVRYLAEALGIKEIYHSKTPEEKLEIVRAASAKGATVFVGDGINDAPALLAATVGIAVGHENEIAAEAAGAVILSPSLRKLDELMHISARMKSIALESAVGGMLASSVGIAFAAFGFIGPVAGAILQEIIDLFAVLNAVRASLEPKNLSDF